MDKFVAVRVVKANALDLTKFQFDWDLTFAVQFFHADGTVLGRYGSRSSRDGEKDISKEGFLKAMQAALKLHENFPANKAKLAGKQAKPVTKQRPEQYPSLTRFKPELDYKGQVVQSCMHCHQIRDAEREVLRQQDGQFPDKEMYPYPMPDVIGASLDAKEIATVDAVEANTPAAKAGLRKGDAIVELDGQPILSIADVQWVLHHTGDAARIPATVQRGDRTLSLTLNLPAGWRKKTDITWRVSTWMLRRDNFGGMFPVDMTAEERRAAGLGNDVMALRLQHVGQYGAHAVAKRAGFVKGDVITSFDGQTRRMTETELHAYVMNNRKSGDRIPITIRRGDRVMKLTLNLP